MLDPRLFRTHLDDIEAQLARRSVQFDRQAYLALEQTRKDTQILTQDLQNLRNTRSKAIGQARAAGEEAQALMDEVHDFSEQLKLNETKLAAIQTELNELMLSLPNTLDETVPDGRNENDNVELSRWGTPKEFAFKPRDHVELGLRLNGMDFEAAAKLTGSRFVTLSGPVARLQRALTQFMLDTHTAEHGYCETYVPFIVNAESLRGTGQLPKFKDDLFQLDHDSDWYLIPTAEVPITNLVRNEIIDADRLPLCYVAHTPCFRSEAGSYGKDVRGLIRQHQFEKVELVQIVRPDQAADVHEALTGHAEAILQKLELPYRKLLLCAGDTGFSARKTYDLEVWLPGQQAYREISSCSHFGDFQARRMKARWRNPETGKPELVHTVNGSGLAVGRALVAILENNQDESGAVEIPEVLLPYMGGAHEINVPTSS